jgi:hypothetical protein
MPRAGVDPCLICNEVKCRCGRPAKPQAPKKRKAAQPRVALPVQEPVPPVPEPVAEPSSIPDPWDDAPAPKEAARAAMKARAARSRGPARARVSDHDPTQDAIRALAPILHPDERHKYGALINRHTDVSIRAAVWRQGRANA